MVSCAIKKCIILPLDTYDQILLEGILPPYHHHPCVSNQLFLGSPDRQPTLQISDLPAPMIMRINSLKSLSFFFLSLPPSFPPFLSPSLSPPTLISLSFSQVHVIYIYINIRYISYFFGFSGETWQI